MSLRFIYGRGGSGKSHYCLQEIKENILRGVNHKLVLLVPEQFSFQSERNLLKVVGATGITKAEVLSFKRLAHRVFNDVGGVTLRRIDDTGKSMLIYNILEELGGDLKYFGRASKQQGFIDIVSDTIREFKRYNITPEIIEDSMKDLEQQDLKYKLQDLKAIYERFQEALHKEYIDSEDELTLLAEKLDKCSIYDGAEVWIDEFSTFTPQQYTVLQKLLKKCKRVNITLTSDELDNIHTVDNTDIFSVTKNTERKFMRLIQENNVGFEEAVNLNKDCCPRFSDNKELQHIERYFYAAPYRYYEGKIENLRIYKAFDNYDEIEMVSRDIIRLVRDKGYRFKDIAVVCRELESYEKIIAAIFREYGIPYFLDMKRTVSGNPLVVFIISVFDIFTKNWSYETVFRYLKTGLTGVDNESLDLLENYILANGIRGNQWTSHEFWNYRINYGYENDELTQYETAILNKINEAKEMITAPLIKLQKSLKTNNNVKSICTSLYEFLVESGALERIEAWTNDFREQGQMELFNEYDQIVDIVMETLNSLVEVMGEEKLGIDKFMKILAAGFQKREMGLIPISLDEVMIGDIARIRSQGVKALYIIGVNDGVFPKVSKGEGILSDRDREILRDRGLELAADTKTQVFEEQFLVYTTLTTPCNYLILTYPMANFEGKTLRPSVIISRMKKIFPKLQEESELVKLKTATSRIEAIAAPGPTFNELVSALRRKYEGEEIEDIWGEIYKWYDSKEEWKMKASRIFKGLEYSNVVENVDSEKIKNLYGRPLNFSVSRIEQYAQCPFAYFVKYGLKAKDRKVYEFSSPDFGSFMHGILDKFANVIKLEGIQWKEISKEWCRETISMLVDQELEIQSNSILNSSSRYKYITDKLKRILTRSVTIMTEHVKRSSFDILANELVFGKGGDLPPIRLSLPSGEEIQLRGRIDRVDSMELDGETYFKVVDYKTGNKSFSLSEVYYGLQLQLLVYLDALLSNADVYIHKQAIPGAILYFRVDDPMVNGTANMTDEEIEKAILKKLKMNGLILKDARLVRNMDKDINGFSLIIPARLNKGGDLADTSSVVTMHQFEILRQYVRDTMIRLCEDMLNGNIEIRPTKDKQYTACNYCSFSAICQFDASIKDNKYRYVNKKKDEEVWSLMERSTEIEEAEEGSEG
ncbi:helicase-exonuclease AddAB subunit AddB [Clostridium thermarum]|uniref:helicase-exonuclease AddAB subunit AddB n=1 Tax=Clostridium thermarum TaxID=1716543 RepID=UPI0013D45C8F|nr:helicase-exonuclease AddAB subunit AddB [Clostridium thermarum]